MCVCGVGVVCLCRSEVGEYHCRERNPARSTNRQSQKPRISSEIQENNGWETDVVTSSLTIIVKQKGGFFVAQQQQQHSGVSGVRIGSGMAVAAAA